MKSETEPPSTMLAYASPVEDWCGARRSLAVSRFMHDAILFGMDSFVVGVVAPNAVKLGYISPLYTHND